MLLGGIEAGGTKFVCGMGNEYGEVLDRIEFPTTSPEETIERAVAYFRDKKIESLGIASFGPVDLDKESETYGFIKNTPKVLWQNYDLLGNVKKYMDVPVILDTDVNAAALGEVKWGAARGVDSCIYVTVGTGIGVGAIVEDKLLHGMTHPEMGHILVSKRLDDHFEGICPFHSGCLEGMASGPAIEKRWGSKGTNLSNDSKVWDLEAYYISQALTNYILILSPKKIILGGGVMKQQQLFPNIRKYVREMLNNYVMHPSLDNMEEYIVPPKLGDNAGLSGALALGL